MDLDALISSQGICAQVWSVLCVSPIMQGERQVLATLSILEETGEKKSTRLRIIGYLNMMWMAIPLCTLLIPMSSPPRGFQYRYINLPPVSISNGTHMYEHRNILQQFMQPMKYIHLTPERYCKCAKYIFLLRDYIDLCCDNFSTKSAHWALERYVKCAEYLFLLRCYLWCIRI